MHLNIYEIFEKFVDAPEDEKRSVIETFRNREDLRQILQLNFHPNIQFDIKEEIPYRPDPHMLAGMGYSNMFQALDRMYLFIAYNPRKPKGLTAAKQREILIQILESLEPKEASIFMDTILKRLNVPGLTYELVKSIFPENLP